MIKSHFFVWKSKEVCPIVAMPKCIVESPKFNDFQKITIHKNQPLSLFVSLSHPDGTAVFEQSHSDYTKSLLNQHFYSLISISL